MYKVRVYGAAAMIIVYGRPLRRIGSLRSPGMITMSNRE